MYRMKSIFFSTHFTSSTAGISSIGDVLDRSSQLITIRFFVMGALLLVGSIAIRLIRLYLPQQRKHIYILLVILVLLLLWIEMGVGVFGSPIAVD